VVGSAVVFVPVFVLVVVAVALPVVGSVEGADGGAALGPDAEAPASLEVWLLEAVPDPSSADATPYPVATAVPTPSATASPPTRPMYLEAPMMALPMR